MAIILAIEPDRRQAAHLSAIVRHQVGAELLLAHTTQGALDAIGNRVPDLVLVPALLSPQDDAALAAALRVIAAAAHVRTLTIPVLGNGVKQTVTGGMLAKWRRRGAASPEPDGCEPAVFGGQIATYLREIAAERDEQEQAALDLDEPAPAPPRATPTLNSDTELRHLTPTLNSDTELRHLTPTLNSDTEVVQSLQARGDPGVEESAIGLEEPLIDLSDELEGLTGDSDDELFDGERVGIDTISAEPEDAEPAEPAMEAFDLLPAILEPAAATFRAPAPVAPAAAHAAFVEAPEPPRADLEPWVPMYLTPGRLWPTLEGTPAETPAPRVEQPDWIELVASLRQDLERRRIDPSSTPIDRIAAGPSDGAYRDDHPRLTRPKVPTTKAKPVQDEWGFFDPAQCGFSTLLAKLDEIIADP